MDTPRCRCCTRPLPPPKGRGRPAEFCPEDERSCRQFWHHLQRISNALDSLNFPDTDEGREKLSEIQGILMSTSLQVNGKLPGKRVPWRNSVTQRRKANAEANRIKREEKARIKEARRQEKEREKEKRAAKRRAKAQPEGEVVHLPLAAK